MSAMEIRTVKPDEREAVVRISFDPPGPELEAIAGGTERGRALGATTAEHGLYPTSVHEVIGAFDGGAAQGVMILAETDAPPGSAPSGATAAWLRSLLGIYPPYALPGLAWRAFLRSRLDFAAPPGGLHVHELHVLPEARNRGIGARLLEHAEAEARSRGLDSLSLTTLMTNPARRLYERAGYRVIGEKRVRGYERLTGAPGRVLMERRL